jgi:hypothetical protein
MLIVRDEQLELLAKAETKTFEDRMVQHLTRFFPDACSQDSEIDIREAIRRGISNAAAYGITREVDVARYIDLGVVLGADFHLGRPHLWVPDILRHPNLSAHEKLQLIFERLRASAR